MSHYQQQQQILLAEMERIKTQMLELEYKQKTLSDQHATKLESVDSNLLVMSKWLETTKILKEYYELDKDERTRHVLGLPTHQPKMAPSKGPAHAPTAVAIKTAEVTALQQLIIPLVSRHSIINQPPLNQPPLRFDVLPSTQLPSEFMINFVESTFNMFNLMNDRIKILEAKLGNSDPADGITGNTADFMV